MKKALVVFFLAIGSVQAQDVQIAVKHRVANQNVQGGLCLFSSLETVANYMAINSLVGLTDDTAKKKDVEATFDKVAEVLGKRGVTFFEQKDGNKDTTVMESWLAKKVPVIAVIKNWDGKGYHAIVVVGYDKKVQDWTDARNRPFRDQVVHFIDTNQPERNLSINFSAFKTHWTGRLWVLSPPHLPKIGQLHPLSLPHVGVPLGVNKDFVYPSNQDLKDGVLRPSDRLSGYIGLPATYDYYREYNARK